MRTIRITFARTLGKLFSSMTAGVSVLLFLVASAAYFSVLLEQGEGGTMSPVVLWVLSAAPFAPALAALLTMRLWSEERSSGRLDSLLVIPVMERDLVFGRFFASFFVFACAVALYLVVPVSILSRMAPALAPQLVIRDFLPGVAALLMQGMLWTSIGLLSSASFRQTSVAAFASLLLMSGLPYAAFRLVLAWSPTLRAHFASVPFEMHLIDISTGLVKFSVPVFYITMTIFALFATTKAIAWTRFAGRGARGLRISTVVTVFFAFVFSCLVIACSVRSDSSFEFSGRSDAKMLSQRTVSILSGVQGDVRVSCYLARRSPAFRETARLLRSFASSATLASGLTIDVSFVDPRWDIEEASRLAGKGIPEGTILFEKGRRGVSLPVAEASEASAASALLRLSLPNVRDTVYFTVGHGEYSRSSYDTVEGLSDFARALRRDGYAVSDIDLSSETSVPSDSAAIVVAAPKTAFSRGEIAVLETYLRAGGRLLALVRPDASTGVNAMLSGWSVAVKPCVAVSPRTINGADVVATDFASHPVTSPLKGSMLLFAGAAPLVSSEVSESGSVADRTVFTSLVKTDASAWGETEPAIRPRTFNPEEEMKGPLTLACSVERGGVVSDDLGLRPTRIVVVGDAAFASNGTLASRAVANMDFLLNAVAWLSGLDATTGAGISANAVVSGLEREGRINLLLMSVGAYPAALFALALVMYAIRRRRS